MITSKKRKTILIFGAGGFIGSNLVSFFEKEYEIRSLKIDSEVEILKSSISEADIIINAAGVTRSNREEDFFKINIKFPTHLMSILGEQKNKKIIYFSSIHYYRDDIYGFSKRYSEFLMSDDVLNQNNFCACIRTPGVFGPGSKPNGVSVVSTFCDNLVKKLPSQIVEPEKQLQLIFIEDLIKTIASLVSEPKEPGMAIVEPKSFYISVGELYSLLLEISSSMETINPHSYQLELIDKLILTYKYYQ